MRIALFAYNFVEYTYRLAVALSEHHEVLLFTFKAVAEKELGPFCKGKKTNLRVFLHKGRKIKSPMFILNILEIIQELKKFRPEVIHYQEFYCFSFAVALAFLRKYPIVLTIHDHLPHSGASRNRIYLWNSTYLRRQADMAIVHGHKIREATAAILPWLKGRIVSIPHGPLGQMAGPPQKKWEQGTLLFFGRIEKYKGLPYLIEAVQILKHQGLAIKAIVAGRGNDLETYRRRLELDPAFELIPRYIKPDEIQSLFERANVIVLPYTDGTQSGVAAMALRFGRPVIASDVGSIGEMVRHGYNGCLVPPGKAPALAAAVRKLVLDQSLARFFAGNAQLLAAGEMSWPSIAARSLEVYSLARQLQGKRRLLKTLTRL